MQNERISFDAMPEMLAAIAQKLESIELTISQFPLIMKRKMSGSTSKGSVIIFPVIRQNRLSMDGLVLISFLFTRKGRVLHSASQRLTNGYNKATERVRLILCERPANLLTGRKTNNNLS